MGRAAQLGLFRSLLAEPDLPWAVVFVHGAGGVGKTALLGRFLELARQAGVIAARLDARTIEPSPPAFLAGLAAAFDLPEGAPPLDALGAGGRHVLLFDTYEAAAPLDEWLRERFLPQLPTDVLVVIAGRNPPGPEWVADPGWHELLRVLPLAKLEPPDTRAYLQAEGIGGPVQERLVSVTHGHPLALALMTDVLAQRSTGAEAAALVELADAPEVPRDPTRRSGDEQVCGHGQDHGQGQVLPRG